MGSLMAGWQSAVPDPKTVKFQRNRSLTKEEIDSYWRSKKQKEEEEHVKVKESEINYQRSNSVPLTNTKDLETEEKLEKLLQKNGWWISSNWAFLNEPPVIASEGPTYKYASQFHVATGSKSQGN